MLLVHPEWGHSRKETTSLLEDLVSIYNRALYVLRYIFYIYVYIKIYTYIYIYIEKKIYVKTAS